MIRAILLLAVMVMVGCTENQRARGWGGSQTVNISCGQKVTNMTWKGDELWIQTRPFRHGEQPEMASFVEKSSFGMLEGTVLVQECL